MSEFENENRNDYGNGYENNYENNYENSYGNNANFEEANVLSVEPEVHQNSVSQNSVDIMNDMEYDTPVYVQPVKKKGSGKVKAFAKKSVAVVATAAVFGVVAGGSFNLMTGGTLLHKLTDKNSGVSSEEQISENASIKIPATDIMTGEKNVGNLDVSDIAESVMPSVVSITIKGVEEVRGFFGMVQQYEVEGSGSGIIIGENDSELLIVTNNHVVSDATTVSVQFIDEEVCEAKVKGTDADNDLAIISIPLDDISKDTLHNIKVASIGSSDNLKVGEQVVAIGNALGYGQSVTTGIVSALERTVDTNSTPLIQTDAAINPGNSGGALLNMNGQVIGINSSKYASTDVEGMGYAIPISQVESILNELMNRVTRDKVAEEEKGYLGISCGTVSAEASEMYGIPEGVLISEVSEDSAAEKAGLKKNYVITKFDGQTVKSADELVNMLGYYKIGEAVEVTYKVLQDDEYVEKTVTVILQAKSVS